MSKVQTTNYELEQSLPEQEDLALGQFVQTEGLQILWDAYERNRSKRLSEIRDHLPEQSSHEKAGLTDNSKAQILHPQTRTQQATPASKNEINFQPTEKSNPVILLAWQRIKHLFPILNTPQSANEIQAQRIAAKRQASQKKLGQKAA